MLGFRVHHPSQGSLDASLRPRGGGMGEVGSKLGGAAPGSEPWTSCMRVRSVTVALRGPPHLPIKDFSEKQLWFGINCFQDREGQTRSGGGGRKLNRRGRLECVIFCSRQAKLFYGKNQICGGKFFHRRCRGEKIPCNCRSLLSLRGRLEEAARSGKFTERHSTHSQFKKIQKCTIVNLKCR